VSVVLSKHLPLLASAPHGIQKLRGLILELAVRGKLVPQDPNDEPASELLKRIAKERTKLEAEGKIKRSKPLPPVDAEEQPFALPDGWEWARLGVISTKLTDGSHNPPPDSGSGLPMLSSQNVQDGWIDTSNPSRYLSDDNFVTEDSRTKVSAGDVLLTIVASIGRSAVVKREHGRFALQRSVAVIRTEHAPDYLLNP
jgi:type I restriction enzyme S subunit